jgi:hypothetical protein
LFSGGWPAAPGNGLCLLGHPAGVIQGPAQEQLDLGIEAPQLVRGPPGQRVVHRRVKPERDLLAFPVHE